MKKTLIISIIIFALFIPLSVSCTQDASEGIYAQVVTQGSSAKYKIKQFIHYDSASEKYYFLEVGGVYKNAQCIIPGNFSEAFYDNNSLYVLDKNGNINKYNLNNLKEISETKSGFAKLTPNGYALEAHNSNVTNLYKISSGNFTTGTDFTGLPNKFFRMLWAGDTVLVQRNIIDDYSGIKTFILSGSSFKEITGLGNKQVLGFQNTSSTDKYYVLTCDNDGNYGYYKINADGSECVFLDEASTPAYNVTQAPSYYDNVNDVAVFRCASYYDEIDASTDSVTTGISGGFASSIHTDTMEVVSMVPTNDDKGSAVIAFYKYGLFKANIKNSPSTLEIKF